jgi:hypothetical protein
MLPITTETNITRELQLSIGPVSSISSLSLLKS